MYWAAFTNREEADYLCAILNSQIVNLAIKPFQAVGLLGERHIQKKLLELPLPTFNHEDENHVTIAACGAEARKSVKPLTASEEFKNTTTVARQRAMIRTHLKKELQVIDKLVTKLLSK